MPTSQMSEVVQQLRRAVFPRDGAGLTDKQLLADYVCRRDEAALAARLAAVARDRSSLAPLVSRGRERAARFSVEALAERTIRVYERAASRRGESA